MDSGVNSPAALLAVIYVLEGVGRGVFEGPNRSVYADWFENRREMAFACWIVQSGGSASIAFFMLALDVTPTAVRNQTLLPAVRFGLFFPCKTNCVVGWRPGTALRSRRSPVLRARRPNFPEGLYYVVSTRAALTA